VIVTRKVREVVIARVLVPVIVTPVPPLRVIAPDEVLLLIIVIRKATPRTPEAVG